MAAFLYYIEGVSHPSIEDVNKVGLGFVCRNQQPPDAPVMNKGPDGKAGCIVSFPVIGGGSPKIGYYKDNQTWRKSVDGNYWIGYQNDAKPGPDDLALPNPVPGYLHELGDGNKWECPTARDSETDEPTLPSTMDVNEKGKWGMITRPEYIWLWDEANKFLDIWIGKYAKSDEEETKDGESVTITIPMIAELSSKILGVNYMLKNTEVGMLGLLTSIMMGKYSQMLHPCLALIDWWAAVDRQKKKPQEVSATT